MAIFNVLWGYSWTTAEVLKSFDLRRHFTTQGGVKAAATMFSEGSEDQLLLNSYHIQILTETYVL